LLVIKHSSQINIEKAKRCSKFHQHKFHEKVAEHLFRYLIDECPYEDYEDEDKIKTADRFSSALSRIVVAPEFDDENLKKQFEEESSVDINEAKFIDIFSGKDENIQSPKNHTEVEQFFETLGEFSFSNQDERAKFFFLFLWRFLPEIFPWIEKHPADSRVPNHSIYDHCTQTSAIVSSLPKPAFLIFTLGPVQKFIATSRKTSDLWSGSFLLSFLTFEAMKHIIEKLGPDHIIYPHLREQPFADLWLISEFYRLSVKDLKIEIPDEKNLKTILTDNITSDRITIANIPNRFVAIIPYDTSIAEECEKRFKDKLGCLADRVVDKIFQVCEVKNGIDKDTLKSKIKNHLEKYFQVYWVVLPWFKDRWDDFQIIFSDHKKLMGGEEVDTAKAVRIMSELPYYKPANVGLAYSLLLEIAERFLGARKSVRIFEEYRAEGEKCHLCGEFEVLEDRSFWNTIHNSKPSRWARKDERLCALCLVKRVLPDMVFDMLKDDYSVVKDLLDQLWLKKQELKFPSTSDMATVFYKLNLPEDKAKNFKYEFEKFREKLKDKILKSSSVPALKEHPLYDIDGEWLMEESYNPERLEREYGLTSEKFEKVKGEYDKVLGIVRDFREIPKYYALLLADGDEMGKWLKGEKMPKIKDLIHHKVIYALLKYAHDKDKEKIEKLLCSRHPVSPSFHSLFSRRLSYFSVREVRRIVESESYGKLVYAGGDDVLALLPIDTVFACAKKLNDAFRNSLSRNASLSVGIVIAHHKYPLSLVLDEVRDAERKAKNEYGRASVYLKFIRRQGEVREFGVKWENWERFDDILCFMRGGQVPSRLGYQINEVLHKIGVDESVILSNSLYEIFRIEIKRILSRKEIKTDFVNLLIDFSQFYKSKPTHFADMIIILNEIRLNSTTVR